MEQAIPCAVEARYDLVVASEILWYLLPKLGEVLRKIHQGLSKDGVFAIEQFFPAQQNFGKEYLSSPEELKSRYLLPAGFPLLDEVSRRTPEGNVLIITVNQK